MIGRYRSLKAIISRIPTFGDLEVKAAPSGSSKCFSDMVSTFSSLFDFAESLIDFKGTILGAKLSKPLRIHSDSR